MIKSLNTKFDLQVPQMIFRIVQNPACLEQLHNSVKQSALDLWKIPRVEIYIGHLQKRFIKSETRSFSKPLIINKCLKSAQPSPFRP